MIDKVASRGPVRHGRVLRGFQMTLLLVTAAIIAWFTAFDLLIGFQAVAAEVDAVGVPAPLGFADIVGRVKPAVVGVRVRIEEVTSSDEIPQKNPYPPGSTLDRFSRQFGVPIPDSAAPKSGFALGSGFFISGDGYIVTNNHLVANGKRFEVTIDSGKTYEAKVIGTDPQTDLALIKVSASTDFPYVRLAAEAPRTGDWVLVVGNPFGLGGTVTAGIVSARGRDIGEGPYDDFIQIDAPVNLGNSGGPTFNVRGEVIGVNTAIFSPGGGSVGVAFDIPPEIVKLVVQQLKDKGHVTRGWIGVQIQSITPAVADAIGLKNAEGGLIADLEPHGPAAKGGIEIGDVVIAVNGEAVKDSPDLARKIASIAPGTSTKFGIFRNGKEKIIAVTVGKFPRTSAEAKAEEQKGPSEAPVLGFTLAPARAVAGAGDQGVVITEISPTSRAAESGLQTGDVILDVGRSVVNTTADVRKMVAEARMQSKRSLLLRIKRGDTISFVAIPLA
jgi:serine protease Do